MNIAPLISKDKQNISGYGKGFFTVNEQKVESDILISAQKFITLAKPVGAEPLPLEDVGYASALDSHWILLIGIASERDISESFIEQVRMNRRNLSVEVMGIGAACRTYSILLSEGRNVIASLSRL